MMRDTIRKSAMVAGTVTRYHAWPTLRQQTVAEHSFNVLRLYVQIWGDPPREVTRYIVMHDLGELVTGDLPFPVKTRFPELKTITGSIESEAVKDMGFEWPELSDVHRTMIKICDLLEMTEYALLERQMGNHLALPIEEGTSEAVFSMVEQLPKGVQQSLFDYWTEHIIPWAVAMNDEEKKERGLG